MARARDTQGKSTVHVLGQAAFDDVTLPDFTISNVDLREYDIIYHKRRIKT